MLWCMGICFWRKNWHTVPVVDTLCEFIVSQENSDWIANNGGRFDTIFIFKYLLEKKKHFPESIMCTWKYLLFLTVILSYTWSYQQFQKQWVFRIYVKGFILILFYDFDYEGVIVDKIVFDIDNMDEKTKNDF